MGRPKKVKVEVASEVVQESEGLQEQEVVETPKVEVESKCKPPHLPKCQCQDVLGTGQAYFEDGQTGTVIIGEDTKGEVLLRYNENGKEYSRKINKKR